MSSVSGIVRRLRGDHIVALSAEVAALREVVLQMNHVLVQTNHTLMELNHEVHAGAEEALPLFLGYAERLRLDADTAIGAAEVIERQLSELEHAVAALRDHG